MALPGAPAQYAAVTAVERDEIAGDEDRPGK
jgi:hypothetical protein